MDIVEKLKAKDEEAYEELIGKYKDTFYYMSRKYIKDREECRDCVQEIFLKIYQNIQKYDSSKGNLNAWLIKVAKNHIIDYYRVLEKNNERYFLNEDLVQRSPTKENVNFSILLEELREYLGHEEYEILLYRVVTGLTFEEIGEILHVEKHTIRRTFMKIYNKSRKFASERGYLND